MGAGGKVRFGEYLRKLGLGDKPAKKAGKADKVAMDARLRGMGIVPQKDKSK